MEYNKEYLLSIGTEEQREEFADRRGLKNAFDSQARYFGSVGGKSLYGICGITSDDTAELFKMFVGLQLCASKEVEYDEEKLFDVEE